MTPTRALRTLALSLAAVPLLAGCGANAVSASDVEEQISTKLEEQVGQAPDSVECPEDLPAEEGATMECTLTAGEDEVGVTVTVNEVDGSNVNFDIAVDDEVKQ